MKKINNIKYYLLYGISYIHACSHGVCYIFFPMYFLLFCTDL